MEMEQLIKLINTVSSSKLTEFKYEENGIKIGMKKEQAAVVLTESTVQPKVTVEQAGSDNRSSCGRKC